MLVRTLGLLCFLLSLELIFSQSVCPTGKWGSDCSQDCTENCAKNCERLKGTCYGCKTGWFDSYCDGRCDDCQFGCNQNTGLCLCDVFGCANCSKTIPGQCDSCNGIKNYVPSTYDSHKCCSAGCNTGAMGVLDCHDTGNCVLDDCETGFWGPTCLMCSETIEHCDICRFYQNSPFLICTKCQTGYEISNDERRCCPAGCDDCVGDVCSVCKTGYFVYGDICDTCGENCQPPPTGPPNARCNPETGNCTYGCQEDWHGYRCNVPCDLPDCDLCDYNEPSDTMTCHTCDFDYAPNLVTKLCEPCNVNCLDGSCDPTTGECLEGCFDGWRGDRCDESCEDAGLTNCTVCGRHDLTCSECTFNNWGPLCEYECSSHCGPVVNAHVCDKDTAECAVGCVLGFWREDCQKECPNCLGDMCDIIDGECSLNACKSGFWSDDCLNDCPINCAKSPIAGVMECDFGDGVCKHGCSNNQYGDHCDRACDANCLDNRTTIINPFDDEALCQQDSGDCTYGCNTGFYLQDCSEPCETPCVTGECDRGSGFCPACSDTPKGWKCFDGECPIGKHGQFCQANCTGGLDCLNRICNRFNGDCEGCELERWGEDCEYDCFTCTDGICDQNNGNCILGCVDGTWGDNCEKVCHDRCSVCDQDTGVCATCDTGLYGSVCERNCSTNCLPSHNNKTTCNIVTGHCNENACKSGFYGLTCRTDCNEHCAPNKHGVVDCAIDAGECFYGCNAGWFGDFCTGDCFESCRNKTCIEEPDNCVYGCSDFYYGGRCELPCSVGCKSGVCDDFGECIYGCEEKMFGDMCDTPCNETCIDNRCNRQTGRCEYCYSYTTDNFYFCRKAYCDVGKTGNYCNETCPGGDGCLGKICNRYTSVCEGCESGLWGEECQNDCSTCAGVCDQITGVCDKGCIDGYFGQQCKDECIDRCDVCNRLDGSCTNCSVGTYGPVCEFNCSSSCALKDGKLQCEKASGTCSSGKCVPGFFGRSCDNKCYEHCSAKDDSVATCNYTTGYCDHGCETGWYGLLCTGECSSTCRNKHCVDDSNNCLDGCTDKFYGEKCLQSCNSGCYLGICDDTGYCKAGCVEKYFGSMCTEECTTTCIDNNCDRFTGNCTECSKTNPGILCRKAPCPPGMFDLRCDKPCPSDKCLQNRCNRDGGKCEGCPAGLFGTLCYKTCENCNNGACDQDSGKCKSGCIDGWYGELCDLRCYDCVNCKQSSGLCTECPAEKYGRLCEYNCSTNCIPTITGSRSCHIYTAACASLACEPGYYEPDCFSSCHKNCEQNQAGHVICDLNTGACSEKCKNLFYGTTCETPCKSYCHDMTCDRVDGICADCVPPTDCPDCPLPPNCPGATCNKTFWGQDCSKRCPDRCDSRGCDRYIAKCINCLPGFRGDYCNYTCSFSGCYSCNQTTGLCDSCKPGKYGINCNLDCGGCELINGEVRCDMMTGKCLADECQPGKWGLNCSLDCNANCADRGGKNICHRFTGECTFGCDLSFFGDFCDKDCSPSCRNSNCNGDANNCQDGCAAGYYGLNTCQTPCSSTCKDKLCSEVDGVCSFGCNDGFYTDLCSTRCAETCINGKCDRKSGHCPECTEITTNPYYFCRTEECTVGLRDDLCDKDCPEHCDGKCNRYTAKCNKCEPKFYGDNCTESCENCQNGNCNQQTGYCDDGCLPGYFGLICEEPCKFGGCETCDRRLGLCDTCKNELFGTACERDCSTNCTTIGGLHLCNKDTGNCKEGSCLPGSWDLDCFKVCNSHCKEDAFGDRTCYYQSGRCTNGCKDDKFWGEQCESSCSTNCEYELCRRDSSCLVGCIAGNYGPACEHECDKTCNDGKCDRVSGECAECNKTLDQQTELCRTAPCPIAGKTGVYCNISCPENCISRCDRNTNKCEACKDSWWGNNCTNSCGNCASDKCFQFNGTCSIGCEAGFWGSMCLDKCKHSGCQACVRYTGECSVCNPNLWGLSCNKSCSLACPRADNGDIFCNQITGACDVGTCAVGYYGTDCTKKCSPHCVSNVCDFDTGVCTIDCLSGWWNDFCNQTCSTNCVQNQCSRNGQCDLTLGCKDGFSGFDCTVPCSETCIDDKCNRDTGRCTECSKQPPEQRHFTCRTADCEIGVQGLFCNESCPVNCLAKCDRYNSTCEECLPGFYNKLCDTKCSFCANTTCDQATGTCDFGCQTGYFGDLCQDKCLHDGCKTCGRQSGQCEVCLPGLYGKNCSEPCSTACQESQDGLTYCLKDSGACREGVCTAGWYGDNCDQPCPGNCSASENGFVYCNFTTGSCDDGCEPGWYEPKCDAPCSANCADTLCNRTGYCSEGCKEKFYGYFCEEDCSETCNDYMCDRHAGNCSECYVTNREPTFECRRADCPPGLKGLNCDEMCPQNCLNTCHRYDDTCDACQSGFYGDFCNITCGNCKGKSCNQDSGDCLQGCINKWYGLQCMQECLDPNCQTCDIITGTCDECDPSYYGLNCEKSCSSFCARVNNQIRCNRTSGFCSPAQCEDGYYLQNCTKSCNDRCGADFNTKRPCDILSGKCKYDCVAGWYGDTCDRGCSDNCVDNACNRTGYCLIGCETGFYRGDCRLTCAEQLTCNDGTCHRFNGNCSACDPPMKSPECRDADCPMGSWGLNCQETCPPNCEGGVCEREDGTCKECNSRWYGDFCDSQCLHCEDDICFQSSGDCIKGCKDGFYTKKCNTPCLFPGCKDCTRDNGTCISCKVGKYNSQCSGNCSLHCALAEDGRTCSKASGHCNAKACRAGFWAETCTEPCSAFCDSDACILINGACSPCKIGHFGIACRQECSDHCKNKKCEGTFDNCVEGCATNYWGTTCEKDCNPNCVQGICDINTGNCTQGCTDDMYYGITCKEPCKSNCDGGKCDRDGRCRKGCTVGSYGLKCDNSCPDKAKCTDGTCDRIAGNCTECDAVVPGPLCPTADCPSGKRGKDCTEDCSSSTCLYNRCTRTGDDICVGCPIGLTGSKCDTDCGKCKLGTGCNQISGVCDEGCRDGFYGEKCDQACSPSCQSCERYPPAKCVVCTGNRWGDDCLYTCNPNCAKTVIGSIAYTRCEKATGHCSEGACDDNRFWRHNCSEPCPEHCRANINGIRACRISDGACSDNCADTYHGIKCTERCSTQCLDRICLNSANNCVRGCAAGFYGSPTCSGTCSSWCKTPNQCDPETGSCIGGCTGGYFGDRCIEQCYGKCKDGTCDENGGCPDCRISPVGPNCHPQVCPALKYGPSCESDCPGLYCKDDLCHRQTGKCPQGCQEWFHGEYCTERCICDLAGTKSCDQDGVCDCVEGRTSVDCSQDCSDGCRNNVCAKNGQCSQGCITGRYGFQCQLSCGNCVDEDCDANTGECRRGCKPGFYGSRCDEPCGENCLSCMSSSACTRCVAYRYGLTSCAQICSATCNQPTSGRLCSESTGACIDGCVTGFYGTLCDKRCEFCGGNGKCSLEGNCQDGCRPGHFTAKCVEECSVGCDRGGADRARECNIDTGKCTYGCETGFYGDTCTECSSNCLGKICSSATVCTDGCAPFWYGKDQGCTNECLGCKNGQCDDTGICQAACKDGLHGTQCNKVCYKLCKDDTCDQASGECADCAETPVGPLCRDLDVVTQVPTEVEERLSREAIIAISASCAAAVIIIVILMVCCVFYRRQASDTKIQLPSDVLERLSTHRSHHSTISSQYPVARVVGDDEKDFALF